MSQTRCSLRRMGLNPVAAFSELGLVVTKLKENTTLKCVIFLNYNGGSFNEKYS